MFNEKQEPVNDYDRCITKSFPSKNKIKTLLNVVKFIIIWYLITVISYRPTVHCFWLRLIRFFQFYSQLIIERIFSHKLLDDVNVRSDIVEDWMISTSQEIRDSYVKICSDEKEYLDL